MAIRNAIIFWDIDGTLISLPNVSSIRHLESVELFAEKALMNCGSNLGKTDIGIIRDIFEFNEIKYQRGDLKKCLEILNQNSLNQINREEYGIIPGVVKALNYCNEKGVVNSVLTGNSKARGVHKINLHNLASKFDLQLGFFGDSHFSRVDLVKFAKYKCSKLGIGRIALIGDTQIDVDSAKSNDVEIVAVSTGKDSFLKLSASKPNLLLRDFEKDFSLFQTFIDELNSN